MALIKPSWPDLASIEAEHLPTRPAAHYLGREPETLRKWAAGNSSKPAPITPVRVRGRLLWPVARIRELLKAGGV